MQVQAFLTALPVRYVQQLLTYSCWQKVQKNHRSSFFLVSHSHGLTSRRQTALARTAKRQRPAQYYPRLTHEQPCHVEGFPLTHQTLNAENCANHPASQFWSTIFEPAAIVVRAVSSVLQLPNRLQRIQGKPFCSACHARSASEAMHQSCMRLSGAPGCDKDGKLLLQEVPLPLQPHGKQKHKLFTITCNACWWVPGSNDMIQERQRRIRNKIVGWVRLVVHGRFG